MATTTGALSHVRIVELGCLAAGAYCGKLFADFGADVVKIAVVDDPLRAIPPLVDIGNGQRESAFGAWLNTNKRSVAPNAADLDALLAGADVLIDSGDPATAVARHAGWRKRHPALSIISLSWFGETGPYRDYRGTDAVIRALAGLVKLTGPVAGPPIMLNDHQASIYTGLTAYSAALAALLSGTPRRFEISVFEASVVLAEFQIALRSGPPVDESRLGTNKFYPTYPLGIFACREGWLGVTVGHLDQWAAFCDMLGLQHVQADPRFQTRFDRSEHMAEIDEQIAEKLTAKTADEWFRIALARRVPLVVVPDMAELLAQPIHRERGAFQTVRIGGATFEGPSLPLHLTASLPARSGTASRPGADAAPDWEPRSLAAPMVAASERPLTGIRVLDLSMGWAGPLATRQLSDLGAEIVKVEACAYPDWWRPTEGSEEPPFEHSPWFIALNRNKLDVGIDMYTPQGLALVKRLVAESDVVVENFSAGVMPRLGLTYDALKAINPALIMLSMPSYAGEWSDLRAYGSTLEHGSGLPSVTGPADGPPVLNHLAYGDPIGGLNGCAAVLTALRHRRLTGGGQHILLSQIQAMLPLAAPWIIEQSVTGTVVRYGNRHPQAVPHNIFPTADPDGWIVITATDSDEWHALTTTIGRPDLATLGTVAERRAREDELEAAIAAWSRAQLGAVAMRQLQEAGVPAGVVSAPGDLHADPHLVTRDNWQIADRRWSGKQPYFASPFREEGQPYMFKTPSPTLGEHNWQILHGLLGLGEADIAALEEEGVVGDRGKPRRTKPSNTKDAA
jgi:crotonobetainyl-CoA:carnitine CoA-transferase CaiB-like acyl-CoA transferase